MTELEKFKRRLIRMVARLHVQEKKPEDELWEYLRKQTKCDCKWLWERMRALTLKRLKRLLLAEDRQDKIPAVARMSLTDWLLFDCILVHEKIDVIGQDLLLAEGRSLEPRPLFELFSLVQRYELEPLAGEELARAWTAATVAYNSSGRQCSPMLLQRRWYQLKELTRNKFYTFWFEYRGNAKLLARALDHQPTRLQSAVARRYPHIITTPFMQWEQLIENKRIIMPQEFSFDRLVRSARELVHSTFFLFSHTSMEDHIAKDLQMKLRSANFPKPIQDNDADLILLEPEIETIDLGIDSDPDDELRDAVEGSKAKQIIANEDATAVQGITLKQEPVDEDEHLEEEIDLDSTHMEAIDAEINHIEGIEALENMEIPIQHNLDIEEQPPPSPPDQKPTNKRRGRPPKVKTPYSGDVSENESRSSTESVVGKENIKTAEVTNSTNTVEIPSSPSEDEIQPQVDLSLTSDDVTSIPNADIIVSSAESDVNTASPKTVMAPQLEPTEDPEISYIDASEPVEMPQITNVFGNVNIPDDALQKLSSYLDKTKNDAQDIEEEIEEDIIKMEIEDEAIEVVENQVQESDIRVDVNNESEGKLNDNLLDDVIPDVTFEDDGIEFIDDGIIEDEGEYAKEASKSETSQSIDLKLLMVPVVYTKKLDNMKVLRNKSIFHVDDAESIDLILAESKPESKKSMEIKEENQPENKTVLDEEEDGHDDLFDKADEVSSADSKDETISEDIRVAASSILFKKPRNRDYGPLVVCKNPDFNTRLKRLTAGFLSYTRNRFLLRDCKPLTIDLCKAFESKLINNTIYLKDVPGSGIVVKQENLDIVDKERLSPSKEIQENVVQANAVSTTDSVQSLIDNMHAEKLWSPPAVEPNKEVEKLEDRDSLTERNKVINLPNIDNVRRINQKLLVAEVSPMRVENSRTYDPPVSLLTQPMDKLNLPTSDVNLVDISPEIDTKEVTSGKVICSGQVINNVTRLVRNYKPKLISTWWKQGNAKIHRGFWNSKQSKPLSQSKCLDEQLLTADTLNKMLFLVNKKDPVRSHEETTHRKFAREAYKLKKKADDIQRMLSGETSRSDTNETNANKQPPKGKTKRAQKSENKAVIDAKRDPSLPKRGRTTMEIAKCERPLKRRRSRKSVDLTGYGYGEHCCWARFKKLHPLSGNSHPCGVSCVCCCTGKDIEAETDPSIQKVYESIESVIEQSREIVENETFENQYLKNKALVKSNEVSEEDIIIDITEGDNETVENNFDNKSAQNDKTPDITTEHKQIEDTNRKNDSTKIVEENINSAADTVEKVDKDIVEEMNVASNITLPDVNQEQAAVTNDDCVLIDSDEKETQIVKPRVQINISYAGQEQVTKRKRGRPKGQEVVSKPIIKTPVLTLEPRPNNRFNLRSMQRKKDIEPEKRVLFMNSNHIARNNKQPIFLGKNKILLTDVSLPRNNGPATVTQPSPLVKTTLPLPQGVNMMLLPNGILTCTVDPNVQLSPEEIANITLIVETVQKQINSAVSGVSNNVSQGLLSMQVPSMQMMPAMQMAPLIPAVPLEQGGANNIVSLVDDQNNVHNSSDAQSVSATESSAVNITSSATEDVVPFTEGAVPTTEIAVPDTEGAVPTTESAVPTTESAVLTMESTVPVREGADTETAVPDTESAVSSTKSRVPVTESADPEIESVVTGTDNVVSDGESVIPATENVSVDTSAQSIAESSTANSVIDTTDNNAETGKDNLTTSEEKNASQISEKENSVEIEPAKKKTILSDLMEMSGIFDEDIAPVTDTTQVTETSPFTVVSEAPPSLLASALNPGLNQDADNSLRELTPITSYWELKYACSQNGNFFKLDLENKSLSPINVCIKRKVDGTPKQFVDLTQDDEGNLPKGDSNEDIQRDKVLTKSRQTPMYNCRKNKNNGQLANPNSILKEQQPAKPLKLFKVVHPFDQNVNILQKQKIGEGGSYIVSLPMNITPKTKRQRKQNFAEQDIETPEIDFLLSDEEDEVYEFDGSFEDTAASVNDSDSSDDEPLAKKVRRKEELEKQTALFKPGDSASEISKTTDGDEPVVTTASVVPDEGNAQDEPMETEASEPPLLVAEENLARDEEEERLAVEDEESGEGAVTPTELQFLSDHDNDSDEADCILGF